MQEIEVKFLDVDPVAMEELLEDVGAERVFDEVFEEWIFQKAEWLPVHGRVRLRMNQDKAILTYKETVRDSSEGNTEIEFLVSDRDQALAFIEKMGIPMIRHQQKRRIHYKFDGAVVEIDFWPQIPPLVEIEADSKETIERVATKLGFDMENACEMDARRVIKDIYGVDVDSMKEYVF